METTYLSSSPKDTISFAEKFAKGLTVPKIVLLSGDLGAGKTTFAKGIAKGLGIKKNITSPTFTILNEYKNNKNSLFHFDMYRLNSADEAFSLGFENYFNHKKLPGIILVEWAENVKGLIKKPYVTIELTKENDTNRKIVIKEIK
ncbi:MAG: tRNA (adenosine(37)-N6)-threonylcarbamoyltransferase complex ATPase subunit type 1 TsaE [Clostridia bacterium]|nr:tRNA (adenosine(37)-N6)-threonylcarbamoyltransferase complex ATPase subunit type 1 TsaE [Clostridia bacterium]